MVKEIDKLFCEKYSQQWRNIGEMGEGIEEQEPTRWSKWGNYSATSQDKIIFYSYDAHHIISEWLRSRLFLFVYDKYNHEE